MTNTLHILDAISKIVSQIAEIECVYIDLVPKKFTRPCVLIQPITTSTRTVGNNLLRITEYFDITLFGNVDDYAHSSTLELLELREKAIQLFRKGYIYVNGRAISVQADSAGRDYDKAFIDLQLEYHEVRDNTPDNTPKMETVETKLLQKG